MKPCREGGASQKPAARGPCLLHIRHVANAELFGVAELTDRARPGFSPDRQRRGAERSVAIGVEGDAAGAVI